MQIKTSCIFCPLQTALTYQGTEHLELFKSETSAPIDSSDGVSLAVMIHSGSSIATLERQHGFLCHGP